MPKNYTAQQNKLTYKINKCDYLNLNLKKIKSLFFTFNLFEASIDYKN